MIGGKESSGDTILNDSMNVEQLSMMSVAELQCINDMSNQKN